MAAFDYSSRDYDTTRRDLLARADRVFPEWTDRDPSDFGMMLLDLWAYAADVMHYYIDRAAGEAFLETATQRESVLALANLLDYTPRGRSAAVATVTLQNSSAASVTVDPYTEFVARYDNVTYSAYTLDGGTVLASSTEPITVYEGNIYRDETLTSSASGVSGQRYTMSKSKVAPRSVEVYVYEDGVTATQYQQIARITSAETGDRVFTLEVTADGYIDVVFGTSLNGFVPPTGSSITVTYATCNGEDGNLPANSVISFKNAAPQGLSVLSSAAFSGGLNEESITALRKSIPSAISAQNRAVTRNDFIALALQVEGVAKATIDFTPSVAGPSAGNASVTVYPQAERSDFLTTVDTTQTVSATMQTDIVNAIQPRALLGVDVLCASTITWTPIDLAVTVHVADRKVSNWVKNAVEEAIDELFDFDNVFFGQAISLGQVHRIILNVDGVDYIEITVFDEASLTGVQNRITVDPLSLPKKGTVTLTMVGGITTS